jgi:hypothetical protein
MSQQLAIIVLVDVAAALRAGSLQDHTHLFDNMKLQGSEGEGTGDLVTAINGSSWFDGSQADEMVLNWLPYSLGSIPPTVPRNFAANRSHATDREALDALAELANASDADVAEGLARIRRRLGTKTRVRSRQRSGHVETPHKLIDLTGEVIVQDSEGAVPAHASPTPVITDIAGEAVDEKIIFPAQYGSPDLVTDGWYWSATVDTSRPGTYAYTMEIQLRELVWKDGWIWEPVCMSVDSRIRVTTRPKRNGFTRMGIGMIPIAEEPKSWSPAGSQSRSAPSSTSSALSQPES